MSFAWTAHEDMQRRIKKLEHAFCYPISAGDDGLGDLYGLLSSADDLLHSNMRKSEQRYKELYLNTRSDLDLLLKHLGLEIVTPTDSKSIRKVKK